MVSFLWPCSFAIKGALVLLRIVCVPVAIKRCVEQVAKSVSQSTVLLVKLPRGCPFHSGIYAWCPGHASSQLDWCQHPMSIARCWALLPQQSFLQWALLSLGGMWESLEFSFCFVLYHTLSLLGATVGPAVGTSGQEHVWAAVVVTSPEKHLLPFTNHASSAPVLNADLHVCMSEEFLSSKMLGAAALFCLTLFLPKSPGSINPLCPCFPSAFPLPLSNLSHIFSETSSPIPARWGFYVSAQPPHCTV